MRPTPVKTFVPLVQPLLVLTLVSACTFGSSSDALGSGRPLPLRIAATTTGSGTGPDALVVNVPNSGHQPKVSEKRARAIAAKPPSMPGDASTVEAFRLGRVTLANGYAYSGADPGPFDGKEAWVEVHLVAAGEHAPSAGGTCMPRDAYRWAVLVNAETGAVATWTQGFARGRC